MSDRIAQSLDNVHYTLQDDGSSIAYDKARYVIQIFHAAGIIDSKEARLRTLALAVCPGHNDSREWCAYCGNIKQEAGE